MSADEPWAIEASFSPLEGSIVSKYSPAVGACHAPLMKCPKRRPWRSSQACASLGSSGAGPYSIVRNFSAMLIFDRLDSASPKSNSSLHLRYGMTIFRRITSGRVMFQLPLDVSQQSTGAKPKQLGAHPRLPEFFFHHGQPVGRLLGSANAAGGFESHSHAGLLSILADGASHHQAHRQRGVGRFLAG